jgi:Ca2+-binding EF-hand superfamily protein
MKGQWQLRSMILRCGLRVSVCLFLASGLILGAQQRVRVVDGAPPGQGFGTGGEFGLSINGFDIGTILLKASDSDQDGKFTLAELKEAAAVWCSLWDKNIDASVSGDELATGLKELFPAPPAGATHAVRLVNGLAVAVSPDEMRPDAQVARRILAGADSNRDGSLSAQEVNDFLIGSFRGWDRDGNGSLDAQELNVAFSELAKPA